MDPLVNSTRTSSTTMLSKLVHKIKKRRCQTPSTKSDKDEENYRPITDTKNPQQNTRYTIQEYLKTSFIINKLALFQRCRVGSILYKSANAIKDMNGFKGRNHMCIAVE